MPPVDATEKPTARYWVPSEQLAAHYDELNRAGAASRLRMGVSRIVETLVLVAADVGLIVAAAFLASLTRADLLPKLHPIFKPVEVATSLSEQAGLLGVIIVFLAWGGLYGRRFPFWDEARRIVGNATLAIAGILAALTLAKVSEQFSRATLLLSWGYSILLLLAGRYLVKRALYSLRPFRKNTLIIGAGHTGASTFEALRREPTLGYHVVGFLDDNPALAGQTVIHETTVVGTLADLGPRIESLSVRELIVAIPSLDGGRLSDLVNQYHMKVDGVHVIPNLRSFPVLRTTPEYLLHDQAVMLRIQAPAGELLRAIVKRAIDVIVAAATLIVLSPFLLLVGLLIRLTSKGPAILVQPRLAHRGGTFGCLKFRSMHLDEAERLEKYLADHPDKRQEWDTFKKLRGYDPRVTGLGAFLRKWSVDELPQLINVVIGDMSLVGPRPYLPREIDDIGPCAPIILSVRPGLTGLWQVRGRSHLTFDDRLRLDLAYVRNYDLWLDLSIVVRTVFVLSTRAGAF